MSVTENTSGSVSTTVGGGETTLATVTAAGIYVLRTDLGNMANNDVTELRVYSKARNATDTERLIHGPVIYGPIAPEQKLSDSVPVISTGDFRVTINQTGGTSRAFPWVVLSSGAIPTENTSGSVTLAVGTETTLATVSSPGVYVARVDIANMAASDILEMRVYAKARAGTDTERVIHGPAIYGPIVPEQKLIDTVAIMATGDYKVTLKQTAGTGRAYPWVIFATGA